MGLAIRQKEHTWEHCTPGTRTDSLEMRSRNELGRRHRRVFVSGKRARAFAGRRKNISPIPEGKKEKGEGKLG